MTAIPAHVGPAPDPWLVRFHALVATLIVGASVAGVVVGWRVTSVGGRASILGQQEVQQVLQNEQAETDLESRAALELRLFTQYQEHVVAWQFLTQRTENIRGEDPQLAGQLLEEGRLELDRAKALRVRFLIATPPLRGIGEYHPEDVLGVLQSRAPHLGALEPTRLQATVSAIQSRRRRLALVSLLFVGALFFLTLSNLMSRGNLRRRAGLLFSAALICIGSAATLLFAGRGW